jgi:hypothetical protein
MAAARSRDPVLAKIPVDVRLDRVVAQAQPPGDLRIGQPAGDGAEDLHLAVRQAVGRLGLGDFGDFGSVPW